MIFWVKSPFDIFKISVYLRYSTAIQLSVKLRRISSATLHISPFDILSLNRSIKAFLFNTDWSLLTNTPYLQLGIIKTMIFSYHIPDHCFETSDAIAIPQIPTFLEASTLHNCRKMLQGSNHITIFSSSKHHTLSNGI